MGDVDFVVPFVFSEDVTNVVESVGHDGTQTGTLSSSVFHVGPSGMAWIGSPWCPISTQ